MKRLILGSLTLLLLVTAWGYWWLMRPLQLPRTPMDFAVELGTPPKLVAQNLHDAGVPVSPELLLTWFKLSGKAKKLKAGSYELANGVSVWSLTNIFVQGDSAHATVKLIEGWTFKQVRAALAKAPGLKPSTQGLSDQEIMARLGRADLPAEGHFFPETYSYAKGSTDLALLQRALRIMDDNLAAVWQQRQANLPLDNAEQALVLASLVEKETGHAADREQIAGVFVNRLRKGMLLQTDPSVIYGMGSAYAGTLHKRDLQTDTPWNTYTRLGLPPTPIAMPGRAALLAAVQPASTSALYFVARGDGTSAFSSTLQEHNQAVNTYLRGKQAE